MARSYKEEGNSKYRNHVYNTAIGKYRLALIYLDAETHPSKVGGNKLPTENQLEEWNQLRVDCLNNVAGIMEPYNDDAFVLHSIFRDLATKSHVDTKLRLFMIVDYSLVP